MLRSTVSKVMWVGKATVFLVGLAVILAMVMGLASAALSATGGNFILGQSNSADAPTTLVGRIVDTTKSTLVLKNPNGGSALQLNVDSGQAPMKVNATAGKATNLDADELDGNDSSEFVPTTTYVKTQSFSATSAGGSVIGNGTACDDVGTAEADVLLSGGVKLNDIDDQEIEQSRPDAQVANGWFASVKDDNLTGQGAGYQITILCADRATPHTG